MPGGKPAVIARQTSATDLALRLFGFKLYFAA